MDRFNRRIDYLRISVTDRCNLRCVYCMPECGIGHKPHEELLSFEEIKEIVKAGVALGIDKIRLTGGEPLVRKGVVDLVRILNDIEGIKDISLTTNGALLKEYAADLKRAGLKRLNVSLDTLREDRYSFITRQGRLEDVLEGIRKSQEAGLSPLKINVLLLDDIDEDELRNFLILSIENTVCVRFLEFMPVNSFYKAGNLVSMQLVMETAKKLFGVSNIETIQNLGNGPAKVYRFKHALGSFGIITPISNKFCGACNRLRLSSDGFLRPCLHSDLKVNLRQALRRGADGEGLSELIRLAVKIKPKQHCLGKEPVISADFSMCQIGG